jgi:predicted ester cyclase
MSVENNIRQLRRFFDEVCNNGQNDLNKQRYLIKEIFSESFNFNGVSRGHKDVEEYLSEIRRCFDSPQVRIDKQIGEEDRVSTLRTWTGTQISEYQNQLPTGEPMTWTEISVVRLVNGKITDDWLVTSKLMNDPVISI